MEKTKLQMMLAFHKPGTVSLAVSLEKLGISHGLQKRYRNSGWLESIGSGAMKRPDDIIQWSGGVYALQTQADLLIHPGAMTAIARQGHSHYLRFGREQVFLFSPPRTNLPAWFQQYDWMVPIQHILTSILPPTLGLNVYEEKMFTIQIASLERAMLECLYLAPETLDLVECFQVMEGLVNLRPTLVQELLLACTSVKVKRLFLYLAEKANHQWLAFLDISKLDLGSGDRSLVAGGVYVSKYQLVVPETLAAL